MSPTTVRRTPQRLDQLVVERGLADSRARAQALILAGKVRTGIGDGARLDRKAGDLVDADVEIGLVEADPYVSRGGHKLAAALDAFGIDPAGLVCLDAGASTGGFTRRPPPARRRTGPRSRCRAGPAGRSDRP